MGPLILHLFLVVTLAIDGKDDTDARYGKWWEGEARESNRSLGEEGGDQGNTVTVVVRNECEMALSRAFRLFLSQLSPLTCCMLRACQSKACPEVCSNGWEWRGRGGEGRGGSVVCARKVPTHGSTTLLTNWNLEFRPLVLASSCTN